MSIQKKRTSYAIEVIVFPNMAYVEKHSSGPPESPTHASAGNSLFLMSSFPRPESNCLPPAQMSPPLETKIISLLIKFLILFTLTAKTKRANG